MAQRGSRKRKKRRRQRGPAGAARRPGGEPPAAVSRGYARGREKDEAARAALEPLGEGERPGAVTAGAVVAAALAVANLVALIVRYDPHEPRKTVGTAAVTIVLGVAAWGMWRARYWGVLGMQTILALSILLSSLALLLGSYGALEAVGLVAILLASGVLFWLLVKAMARIQMPERPGARQ